MGRDRFLGTHYQMIDFPILYNYIQFIMKYVYLLLFIVTSSTLHAQLQKGAVPVELHTAKAYQMSSLQKNNAQNRVVVTPRPGWADSYSVNGKCYCATTFDHGIGEYRVMTPAGMKSVREICNKIGRGPGKGRNPVYNTVQCGHEPGHEDAITINGQRVKDEKVCPGRVDQGSAGCQRKGPKWDLSVFNRNNSGPANDRIVTIQKANSRGFGIDGGPAGANGQNTYLWSHNKNNINQQWVEISRGNGYYSYKKRNTNFCLDGDRGGANGQNLYLWSCSASNQNQQWKKVSVGGGKVRLEKRNASGFSINGGNGGANGQNVNLWASSNSNGNQQWIIAPISTNARVQEASIAGQKGINPILFYPNPVKGILHIQGVSTDETITISDLSGKVMMNGTISASGTLNVENLEPGVYLLNTTEKIIRLVKE